jgi:prephenate dehydrogenase
VGRTPAEPPGQAGPGPVTAPRQIGFLGFGLIGGSIAMAIRARGAEVRIGAWSPAGRGPDEGRRRGLVDVVASSAEACLRDSDLVVLAAPPLETLELLESLAGPWRGAIGTDAVVTDVASTKAMIVGRADALGLRFVGGHPMAGREATGVEAASAELFEGRPWVIVPGAAASSSDVARVEWLAAETGARPLHLGAAEHDAAVAAISHLPLVAAVALVEAVASANGWPGSAAAALAASGWRDATRLAAGSPEMGAGILATNAAEVLPRLRDLRGALDSWIVELERDGGPAGDRLLGRLTAARDRLSVARDGPRA